ncbi:hypothetical protein [Salinibacter grassmerensis]|uniref:hypothetical protein n=1 Tax=Salinibacter grassmerensis TaxID=3040353 RepID=UPI0021E6DFA3|nr:hypothetical protein [Salinibacter grassmerensis]
MNRPYFLDEYIKQFTLSVGKRVKSPDVNFRELKSWLGRASDSVVEQPDNWTYKQKDLTHVPSGFRNVLDWVRKTGIKGQVDLFVDTIDGSYDEYGVSEIEKQIEEKCWLAVERITVSGEDYTAYGLKWLPEYEEGIDPILTDWGDDYFVGHSIMRDKPKSEAASVYVSKDDFDSVELYSDDPGDMYEDIVEQVFKNHDLRYIRNNS